MPTIFSIPLDVLNQIVGYLDSRSVQSLSFTCKDAFDAWVVKKHIYRQLFADSDRTIMTDIGLKDQYFRFRRFLDSLDNETGPLVQQIAIPRYMKKSDLAIINRKCCNLVSVDFMCVEEAIDYCPLRLDDNQFSFKDALDSYPNLFRNLKALSIRFEPRRHIVGEHIPDYDFSTAIQRRENLLLPMLEAASQLQSLTLQASHINPNDNIFPSPEPDDNLLVGQPSTFCGTRNLTTVTLLGFPEVLASSVGSVWTWDIFTSAKVVKVSLHSDLKVVEKVYMHRYMEALKAGSARGTFMIESFDTSEAMLHPLEVGEATRLSSEDMRYLRSIGWEPCFDWTNNYLVRSRGLDRPGYWQCLRQESKTSYQVRMTHFIDRLRGCGIPLNVRFEPGTGRGFFPDFHKPSACPESYIPNPNTSHWFIKELGYHFDELTMLWGAYIPFPDTYPCHATYSARYPDGVPNDHYTRLTGVRTGGFMDLEWTRFPGVHDPAALMEKLQREAHGVRPLFDVMRKWCPNIHRLALYIPAAIYADTDQEFIDFVLPQGDFVWAVKHEGSGGGKEALPLLPSGSPAVVKVVKDLKLTTKEYRAECQRLNEKRCPMIHRVFTRTDAASESDASKNRKRMRTERLGSEEEEWVCGQPITVTDLIAAQDDRTLLVDMD
ncbi:MAG: hypothetical protein Q9172_002664 [Xanthocarpia lactea]